MISHLECWLSGERFPADAPATVSSAGKPLKVVFDVESFDRDSLKDMPPSMWRYRPMLPPCEPVTLGEGLTPLSSAAMFGENWYIKDEAVNPTGSFKSRGMSAAVSMAKYFGFRHLVAPSQGNAGGALAAYAARAGLKATVALPADTPMACISEARHHGAEVILVEGLITDCGAMLAKTHPASEEVFNLSTLKEPYRVEGKKTMGYELAEQMGWRLPDVVLYPTGGGTGLVGMWKAFDEMERLGWIDSHRPRMVSVQAEHCCPIVTAYHNGDQFAEEHLNAKTDAAGLRVPKAVGDFIMLEILRTSNGTAIAVSDDEMIAAAAEIASRTGICACPEGGATLAAARKLRESGFINETDTVVLFNTGSGLKYQETLS